jgi:ArsR family transcriptional regulator
MKTREKSVMDEILKILKALSDKNRLRIVKILQQRSLCVCEITSILELATSTVSSHLSILKDAEIIMDQKDGKWVDYRLNTQSKNPYLIGLLPLIAFWLNDDPRVKSDLQKLKTTDRVELCKT